MINGIDINDLVACCSVQNWDDEGADPIPKERFERMLEIVNHLHFVIPQLGTYFFRLNSCGDGTVHASWLFNRQSFELEYLDERFWFTAIDENRKAFVEEVAERDITEKIKKHFNI